ncbi:hypothetical protein AM593_10830, partial [Mytilus galloprovincialis]
LIYKLQMYTWYIVQVHDKMFITKMDEEEDVNFTDDEIRDELSKLGYGNVPHQRFEEFKTDLRSLIKHERSKLSSQNTSMSSYIADTTGSVAGIPSRRRHPLEETQVSHDAPGFLEYRIQIRDDISETDSERRLVKRKVLRKKKDGSKVIDESVTESEAGSLSDIHDRLKELGIRDDERRCQSARS